MTLLEESCGYLLSVEAILTTVIGEALWSNPLEWGTCESCGRVAISFEGKEYCRGCEGTVASCKCMPRRNYLASQEPNRPLSERRESPYQLAIGFIEDCSG